MRTRRIGRGAARGAARAAAGALLAAAAAACARTPMNYMYTNGPVGGHAAKLGWWLVIVSVVVVIVVAVLVLAASIRSGTRRETHEVVRSGGGLSWVFVGGIVVPVIILVLSFAFNLWALDAAATPPRKPAATVQIVGHRWWWEVRYRDAEHQHDFITANEIHVPVGEPVRLELTSGDVIHSFWIPKLAGKTDVIPGQRNVTWIEADSAGIYRGQCTEYCGLQHANMALYVIADPPAKFAEWLGQQRDSAAAPSDPVVAAGQAVFQKSSCAACHAIRGTDALARVGPDLTHLASRMTIAAGTLPNTRGNLAGWIANSQAIKPGNDMPTMTTLSPDDLQALIAYLESLK